MWPELLFCKNPWGMKVSQQGLTGRHPSTMFLSPPRQGMQNPDPEVDKSLDDVFSSQHGAQRVRTPPLAKNPQPLDEHTHLLSLWMNESSLQKLLLALCVLHFRFPLEQTQSQNLWRCPQTPPWPLCSLEVWLVGSKPAGGTLWSPQPPGHPPAALLASREHELLHGSTWASSIPTTSGQMWCFLEGQHLSAQKPWNSQCPGFQQFHPMQSGIIAGCPCHTF